MQIKPDILIHWTGKDICRNLEDLNEGLTRQYMERLENIIKEGFWLTENDEKIIGSGYNMFTTEPRVSCFTDIGMRNAHPHTAKYGLMGIGVSREFLIERDGRPVWYFVNRDNDIHAETVSRLREYLQDRSERDNDGKAKELLDRISLLFDFAKSVADDRSHDYEYLEESEWRIVLNRKLEQDGLIRNSGRDYPEYVIPFEADDIVLLVLPSRQMRKLVYSNKAIMKWLNSANTPPVIISLEEFYSF